MTSTLATEIISKLPEDYQHVTVNNLMPVITALMAHAQEIETLDGPGRKDLVVACVDLIAQRLPFPENEVLKPIVKAVVPPACDAICAGVKRVEVDVKDLLSRDSLHSAYQSVMDRRAKPTLQSMAPKPAGLLQGWFTKIRPPRRPLNPPRGCVMISNPVYTPSRFI